MSKRPHINADGQFQSDKYPTTPAGKVPLSVKDPTAQDLLWAYAQRRRAVDAEFADDLEHALENEGYTSPVPPATIDIRDQLVPGLKVEVRHRFPYARKGTWLSGVVSEVSRTAHDNGRSFVDCKVRVVEGYPSAVVFSLADVQIRVGDLRLPPTDEASEREARIARFGEAFWKGQAAAADLELQETRAKLECAQLDVNAFKALADERLAENKKLRDQADDGVAFKRILDEVRAALKSRAGDHVVSLAHAWVQRAEAAEATVKDVRKAVEQ